MERKNVLTKRFYFERNELDSVAEFLEDKFANGWEMTSLLGNSFGFRKTEPRQVKVSVELVEANGDETEKEQFITYCETEGWKHFFDGGLLQFFYNEDLHALPIHTDEEVKLKLVNKKCFGLRVIFSLAVIIGLLLLLWTMYSNIKYWELYSSQSVVHMMLLPLGIPFMLITMGDYLLWYHRAKQAVGRGLSPKYRRSKVSKVVGGLSMIWMLLILWAGMLLDAIYAKSKVLIIIWLFFAVGIYLFIYMYIGIEAGHNQNQKTNTFKYIVCGVIIVAILSGSAYMIFLPAGEKEAHGNPMLTLEELGITTDGKTEPHVSFEGSPLVKYESGYERWETKYIDYECYSTKWASAYDLIVQQGYFDWDKTYEQVDDEAFAAKEVYLMGSATALYQWLILYDEDILYLETNIELTDQQKQIIAKQAVPEL